MTMGKLAMMTTAAICCAMLSGCSGSSGSAGADGASDDTVRTDVTHQSGDGAAAPAGNGDDVSARNAKAEEMATTLDCVDETTGTPMTAEGGIVMDCVVATDDAVNVTIRVYRSSAEQDEDVRMSAESEDDDPDSPDDSVVVSGDKWNATINDFGVTSTSVQPYAKKLATTYGGQVYPSFDALVNE